MRQKRGERCVEIVRREVRERDGVIAEYRLVRREESYAILAETGRFCEEIDRVPGGRAEAERFFNLIVRELVLPGTIGDVWQDLHTCGSFCTRLVPR